MFQSLIAQLLKNPPAMQETVVRFLGWEDPMEMGGLPLQYSWASLMAQLVKNPPAMQETWVRSLGWEDSPGEGKGQGRERKGPHTMGHKTQISMIHSTRYGPRK